MFRVNKGEKTTSWGCIGYAWLIYSSSRSMGIIKQEFVLWK
jgi:hypothetical protein